MLCKVASVPTGPLVNAHPILAQPYRPPEWWESMGLALRRSQAPCSPPPPTVVMVASATATVFVVATLAPSLSPSLALPRAPAHSP